MVLGVGMRIPHAYATHDGHLFRRETVCNIARIEQKRRAIHVILSHTIPAEDIHSRIVLMKGYRIRFIDDRTAIRGNRQVRAHDDGAQLPGDPLEGLQGVWLFKMRVAQRFKRRPSLGAEGARLFFFTEWVWS